MSAESAPGSAELLAQWAAFNRPLETGAPSQLRPVVLKAWQRCREFGLDPENLQYVFLSAADLQRKQQTHAQLIEAAWPYMEHLGRCFSTVPHVVALSDREGWILSLFEAPAAAFGGAATGVCLGASWNEQHIGNNGIGTALTLQEPTFVYGVEHYGMPYQSAYCVGVPIRVDGDIVGCLDVSVTREEDAQPYQLALVQACVASIESTLAARSQMRQKITRLERFATVGSSLATTLHDLKNSLHFIRGMSQLGARRAKSREGQQYFQKILKRGDEITTVLGDLQAFYQPQALVSTSPKPLLSKVIQEIAPLCDAQQIWLQTDIEAASCVMALQPTLFERVMQNLLSNAVKAMPDGGQLRVEAAIATPAHLRLTIADTGMGIPPEIQDQVFEPFISSRDNGTGLGLYMAHQTITAAHRGQIWFETAPGEGTTFVIELPLDPRKQV